VKHEAGWEVERSTDPDHPPGTLVWISPAGNHHVWRAPALTPAHHYARRKARHDAATLRAEALAASRRAGEREAAPF
jgi:hypothetical protein